MSSLTTRLMTWARATPLLAVFLAAYFVVFLYAHNSEILLISQIFLPLIVVVGLTALFQYLVYRLYKKEQAPASLGWAIFIVFFFNYDLLSDLGGKLGMYDWHLFPLILVIWLHVLWFFKKIRDRAWLAKLNRVLTIVAGLLLATNILLLVVGELGKLGGGGAKSSNQASLAQGVASLDSPPIYLIIFDEMASFGTIEREWGYTNTRLKDYFKEKGFYLAEESRHRYPSTLWSIPSLLNLEYVTEEIDQDERLKFFFPAHEPVKNRIVGKRTRETLSSISEADLVARINDNLLFKLLKKADYSIEVFEGISQWFTTLKFPGADRVISYQDLMGQGPQVAFGDSFTLELTKRTPLYPLLKLLGEEPGDNMAYNATRYVISLLKTSNLGRKSFVYAHLACPHIPYVFDAEGGPLGAITDVNEAYLEQYKFSAKSIIEICDHLLSLPQKPIILIQNDHGPRPINKVVLKDAREAFSALNAVHFPDQDYQGLESASSCLDALRLALKRAIGFDSSESEVSE